MNPPPEPDPPSWRRVRWLTAVLLAAWAAVAFGTTAFARELDGLRWFAWPLGWWIASQGALLAFLALIGLYAWAAGRLDGDADD